MSLFPEPPDGTAVHEVVQDGTWDQTQTWRGGQKPVDDAAVHIPAGLRLIVTREVPTRLKLIRVEGELLMSHTHDRTGLEVETIFVAHGGIFRIASSPAPLAEDNLCKILFISDETPIDTEWDPKELSRGLISHGMIRIFGTPKTHLIPMPHKDSPQRGSIEGDMIRVGPSIPSDWKLEDEVVVTSSHFQRDSASQDELAGIAEIGDTFVRLDRALTSDHEIARKDLDLHLVNLRRNVIFEAESTEKLWQRPHAMFHNPNVWIHHAAFVGFGRTDKSQPLDEISVDTTTGAVTKNLQIKNRRGRYAIHFHKNRSHHGMATPSSIHGNVVRDTAGWGYVNHSSHVDFRRNVCYDFAGAAFVTEAGDEEGDFFHNIAIRGTGDGEYRTTRIVFRNQQRPHPLSDFGFSGDGFWFQGPAIRARRNIACGCNGAGMIWFTTGAADIANPDSLGSPRYVGIPADGVSRIYSDLEPDPLEPEPFHPNRLRRLAHDNSVLISDLPILECNGFEAYGCLVGFHVRFCNDNNVAWYNEKPYRFAREIRPAPVLANASNNIYWAGRVRQSIKNLKLWNNETGLRVRYNSKTDWENVSLLNRRDYGRISPVVGAELFQEVHDVSFTNLEIDGYDVAGWIENKTRQARDGITFHGRKYLNYSSFDSWHEASTPVDVSVQADSTSAQVRWSPDKWADRRRLRYRIAGKHDWQLASVAGRAATEIRLTGLVPGQTYEYQVIASWMQLVSDWTRMRTFETAA